MKKVVVLNSDVMGGDSRELGERLINSFLLKLWASKEKPDAIIFYNAGVKLLASKSSSLNPLMGLRDEGVDLVACGTCIDYFELGADIKVGRVSNMEEILSLMLSAEKTITI